MVIKIDTYKLNPTFFNLFSWPFTEVPPSQSAPFFKGLKNSAFVPFAALNSLSREISMDDIHWCYFEKQDQVFAEN